MNGVTHQPYSVIAGSYLRCSAPIALWFDTGSGLEDIDIIVTDRVKHIMTALNQHFSVI
jgi:hypothetical protein